MSKIEKIPFGRTGHNSSRLLLGAAAFSDVTQAEADTQAWLSSTLAVNTISSTLAPRDRSPMGR